MRSALGNRRGIARTVVAVLSFSVAASCAAPSFGADFVIHISVDGLRPDYMQDVIDAGNAPNFRRLQNEGAWTSNARTDYTHTITLPNHTSMVTGRPVCSPAEPTCNPIGVEHTLHHGYTSNGEPLPTDTLHNTGNLNIGYKSSTWEVVHDAGLSTALYASKSKFVIYEQSYNAMNGAEHPNGRDKIDAFFAEEDASEEMQELLLADLAQQHFNYTFIHYADTDVAGHNVGWGSNSWRNALTRVDGYLGELFQLIENDATFIGRTAIVLSSDHGGSGTSHSSAGNVFHYTIPFFVWGAGVDHGSLYAMNRASRMDPGMSRPTYAEAGQPIRNGDGGNLALHLLGLGAIPGSSVNAAQNLNVSLPSGYVPGDFNFDDVVDAADYVVWRDGLDIHYTQGDFNIWRAGFGETAAASGAAACAASDPPGGRFAPIPEPASSLLCGIVCVAYAAWATGRRRQIA